MTPTRNKPLVNEDAQSQKVSEMESLISSLLGLDAERAVFCLRALMLAGHVSASSVKAAIALAATIPWGKE